MSAEFGGAMGDGSEMYYTFEHDVTRYAVGEIESLRARLADALEQMGYRVLNESPLQARRSAKGGAHSGCSSDILDYQTTLNIGLKSTGTNSTRVAFAYTVKGAYSGYVTKGDRNTLTREAEAILAQAVARAGGAHCPGCGADTVGSSRFCRQCGSPLGAASPVEMEVLRLTSNANASYNNISGGLFFLLLAAAFVLLLLLAGDNPAKFDKLLKIVSIVSGGLGLLGLFMFAVGLIRLRKTLRQPIAQDASPSAPRHKGLEGIEVPNTNELPPVSASHSVIDATTDLLPQEVKRAS